MAQQAPYVPRIGDRLAGTEWRVVTLQGETVPAGTISTLNFITDDRIVGRAGCNRYYGPYASQQERITMGPIVTTRMACSPEATAWEERYLGALQEAARAALDEDGQELVLQPLGGGAPSRFVPYKE